VKDWGPPSHSKQRGGQQAAGAGFGCVWAVCGVAGCQWVHRAGVYCC
jgi:hypothetical protein